VKNHYVYMMASQRNGTIYTGKTNDLIKRVSQHKAKFFPECFTARYNVLMLVYYEHYPDHWSAAAREKKLKKWQRAWKIALIEEQNPQWRDLYSDICQ
jgi:putative endonuclease